MKIAQGLTEPCGVEFEDAVLHVPRHERRRQRLHELCQQKKLKVVLWLAMMYSAQAMEGSPVAGSQGERVFLERVTSLTEAATAATNAAAKACSVIFDDVKGINRIGERNENLEEP